MQPREHLQIPIQGDLSPKETERSVVKKPTPDLAAMKYRDPEFVATGKLASALGVFSLGLGLAELLAPQQLAKLTGVDEEKSSHLRVLGLREIGHGLAILGSKKPTAGVWSRVGGDIIDLAFLGGSLNSTNSNKTRLALSAAAVLGVGALDALVAQRLSSQDWAGAEGNPGAPTTEGQPSARSAFVENGGAR